jgi:diguanylate cyclase (GGDEF)-like protein
LIFLDLDGFKALNDQPGHATGDHVLQFASARAARELRANDCFGRVGGDQFALLVLV